MLSWYLLHEFDLFRALAVPDNPALLACLAFKAQIGFLGELLACHLEFGDGWFGISAHIASATGASASACANLGAVRHAGRGFLLVLAHFLLGMRLAMRAKLAHDFRHFHEQKGS